MSSGERGSITIAVAGMVALLIVLALWTVAVAIVIGARERATTAADAAALAAAPVTFLPFGAAGSPADEAARFARLNGAELISCECEIDRSFRARTVEVRVVSMVDVPIIGRTGIVAAGRADFTPALLLAGW